MLALCWAPHELQPQAGLSLKPTWGSAIEKWTIREKSGWKGGGAGGQGGRGGGAREWHCSLKPPRDSAWLEKHDLLISKAFRVEGNHNLV